MNPPIGEREARRLSTPGLAPPAIAADSRPSSPPSRADALPRASIAPAATASLTREGALRVGLVTTSVTRLGSVGSVCIWASDFGTLLKKEHNGKL